MTFVCQFLPAAVIVTSIALIDVTRIHPLNVSISTTSKKLCSCNAAFLTASLTAGCASRFFFCMLHHLFSRIIRLQQTGKRVKPRACAARAFSMHRYQKGSVKINYSHCTTFCCCLLIILSPNSKGLPPNVNT